MVLGAPELPRDELGTKSEDPKVCLGREDDRSVDEEEEEGPEDVEDDGGSRARRRSKPWDG